MSSKSSDKEGSRNIKSRNRRRSSRKRERSEEQQAMEARPRATGGADGNLINTDNKTELTNPKIDCPNHIQRNRRPRRRHKTRTSNSSDKRMGDARKGNGESENENGNSRTQSRNDDQDHIPSGPDVNHLNNMSGDDMQVLYWSSSYDFVPVQCEEAMVKVMLPRGKRERGMMRNYMFRLKEIKQALKSANGMTLKQALSLRRLYIKNLNPTVAMSRLGLGDEEDIRQSAIIFEECVQEYLDQNSVQYWTEKEQKERAKEDGFEGPKGTPDFLLRHHVMLRKVRAIGKNTVTLEERRIHWVEAKMFYGASTIPQGGRGAVGSLVSKMSTYVGAFGEGAIVFMNGCGDVLASQLNSVGVTVLDCADTIKLGRVVEHQKSWCASRDGRILN